MTAKAVIWNSERDASTVGDYLTLLKPGVMLLVVFSGMAGMMAAPGEMHPLLQAIAILCIALGSGAGGAINMWYDRDIDARMARTAARPVPAGRIAPDDALAFGLLLAFFSTGLMGIAVGWMAASYLAGAIAFYVLVYTMWLKRRTPQNIVIGGAAGALPPVIGWAAVTGSTALEPWLLFAIIFLWTPPHFWALALYRNQDYRRVGVPMMPVVAGVEATKNQMLAYTLALAMTTLAPYFMGMSGWFYVSSAVALGGVFVFHALKVKSLDVADAAARSMFAYSILYLFLLLLAYMLDKQVDKLDFFAFI